MRVSQCVLFGYRCGAFKRIDYWFFLFMDSLLFLMPPLSGCTAISLTSRVTIDLCGVLACYGPSPRDIAGFPLVSAQRSNGLGS